MLSARRHEGPHWSVRLLDWQEKWSFIVLEWSGYDGQLEYDGQFQWCCDSSTLHKHWCSPLKKRPCFGRNSFNWSSWPTFAPSKSASLLQTPCHAFVNLVACYTQVSLLFSHGNQMEIDCNSTVVFHQILFAAVGERMPRMGDTDGLQAWTLLHI